MLNAAHRGYNYQDLLVAIRLVDVLLGSITAINVDEKLVRDDRFDDLTTVDLEGTRARSQFKHREDAAVPLPLATFTGDGRGLRLDHLVACAVADRDGPGAAAANALFRVVVRDARPTDPVLGQVLAQIALDPGPFAPGMHSLRLRFVPEMLWPIDPIPGSGTPAADPFAFLRDGRLRREDFVWFCDRAVVEVEAPAASFDLLRPGPAELLLMDRVRRDVGAETYPNTHRSAVDVAQAIIAAAQAYRQHTAAVSLPDLLRRTQLRQDFGAVARAHPVDPSAEIQRPSTVDEVIRAATHAGDTAKPLLLVGPPGQGKSWACHQVTNTLSAQGWLVAEHYCFLGDSDTQRTERVLGDVVFGSLLKHLADQEPELVAQQRPRFAADERALADALRRARAARPERRVALVVDGLDHVTRVQGATTGRADPSRAVAEELSALEIPQGCALIVLSQPGAHLAPLDAVGAHRLPLPGFGPEELQKLAELTGALQRRAAELADDAALRRLEDELRARFLAALADRSAGNALYATYLCREVVRHPLGSADPAALLSSLPAFDGTLHNYYSHLVSGLTDGAHWVAEILGLLGFAVTKAELREMRPELGHRIDAALERLAPVLIERATQGGIRIYHESFARFLREGFERDPAAATANLEAVAKWLRGKSFFGDARSFRFLLPTLARAGKPAEVLALITPEFASRAVAGGFMASAIRANLATGVDCATRVRDWPALVRCVELARAAETYESERLESTLVEFADVPIALLGAKQLAERLLFDGETTVPARAGIQMCAAIDAAGDVAPWAEYMEALARETEDDTTMYGEASDRAVRLAWLRGRLRTAANIIEGAEPHQGSDAAPVSPREHGNPVPGSTPIRLDRLAEWVRTYRAPAPQVIDALGDTLGDDATTALIRVMGEPSEFALAFAERLAKRGDAKSQEAARDWALTSAKVGATPGTVHRLLRLGTPLAAVSALAEADARAALLALTSKALNERIQFESAPIYKWLDACAIAAQRDPFGLATAEGLLAGEGWFRCWLRFVVGLCRAETKPSPERSPASVDALRLLEQDLRPFVGKPRACDLYRLRDVIASTLRRAIALVEDSEWPDAVRILHAVSDGTAVTLQGEMAGPLPFDLLLDLIIGATTPSRRSVSTAAVQDIQEQRARGRYYADVAGFHLAGAQLALASGDRDRAAAEWLTTCTLLVAYGFHKDITIYELLDPLPTLASKDVERARDCVATVQPLCDRVVEHTDGKDTRHAPAQWWEVLAAADPAALSRIVAPALLARCNSPSPRLDTARVDLWLNQYARADPFVSGVLRLTLPTTVGVEDPAALARLADWAIVTGSPPGARLATLLLARADERPSEYVYTNSSELVARDDERVGMLNAVAARMGAPLVHLGRSAPRSGSNQPARVAAPTLVERIRSMCAEHYGAGPTSLARVLRVWRRRPFDAKSEQWSARRFANAIGYRLLEAAHEGRTADAMFAVRTLAESVNFGEDDGLLAEVAAGLEARGLNELAVTAHTLTWTRSRGRGGWLTFGGRTGLESLKRAAALDSSATLEIIGKEVEEAVAGGRGLAGISQALVYAFAEVDFAPAALAGTPSPLDVAFACWREAADVIATRTPRLHPDDDPEFPYIPPAKGDAATTEDALNAAMAAAAVAGVAHPGREQKRRALVALSLLIVDRPRVTADALADLLEVVADPLTLSWILAVLREAGSASADTKKLCERPLRALAQRPHLTVRALARGLLADVGVSAPPPPVGTPDPRLFAPEGGSIWMPTGEPRATEAPPAFQPDAPPADEEDGSNPSAEAASDLVDSVAGARLSRCEGIVPGITTALKARTRPVLLEDAHRARTQRQLEFLSSRVTFRWPDAILDHAQTVEEMLQLIGGDARAARAAAGKVVGDPGNFETRLATILLNDPSLPLLLEAAREPRPTLEPPPGAGASVWQAIRTARAEPPGPLGATDTGTLLACTVLASELAAAPVVADGPSAGWRVLASVERRVTRPDSFSKENDAVSYRYCGAENGRSVANLDLLPLTEADARVWYRGRPDLPPLPSLVQGPLVGIDADGPATGDSREGLGLACPMLAPSRNLVHVLDVRPGPVPFELVDDRGAALRLSTWRADYVVSDYELARPLLSGARLFVRPDLFERLLASGGEQLTWREYVTGEHALTRAKGTRH